MNQLYRAIQYLTFTSIFVISGCKEIEPAQKEAAGNRAEVSIVHPSIQNITEYIQLNGVTTFQRRENIRSTNTGFITSVKFKQGDYIASGQLFCTLITKEQEALKGIAALDSSLAKFQQPIQVMANVTGVISAINTLQGDYVGEGDVLANVSEPASLVVIVNVPYEYNQFVKAGKMCEILLPDYKLIRTAITRAMPSVDANSQSQTFIISLPNHDLPENLNVSIRISRNGKDDLVAVPTAAVQTDEMQREFWLMKMINDSLAVKIQVRTGLQNDSITEIISDEITIRDNIILQGAYGLPDSSLVIVRK